MNDIIEINTGTLTTAGQAPANPVAAYLQSLPSAHSRRAMRNALRRVVRLIVDDPDDAPEPEAIPWHALRYEHVQSIRARLANEHAPATANQSLTALKQVLRFARRLGLMDADSYAAATDVDGVKGERAPAGRHIHEGEIRALMEATGDGIQGTRNAAILAVLYACGLRRGELVALDLDHWAPGDGLRVMGKGNKERLIPTAAGVDHALAAWVADRGSWPGPLFVRLWRGGKLEQGESGRLSDAAVRYIVKRLERAAGVKPLATHDFRRAFVSHLLEHGADIATVQKLAGHADVSTTARYDRRGEAAKRRAVNRLHVPVRHRAEEEE